MLVSARPRSSSQSGRCAALIVAVGAALSAAVTAAPLAAALPRARVAAAEDVPLAGQWRSFANGDRVNRLFRMAGSLWAATEAGGLVRWDMAAHTYRQYLHPQDGLPSNDVFDVAASGDGALWLATGRGLVRFDPDAGVVAVLTPATSPGMPARRVTAVEPAGGGDLWVGFAQEWDPDLRHPQPGNKDRMGAFAPGGLARYSPASAAWSEVSHVEIRSVPGQADAYHSLPSENVTDIAVTRNGILWVGTRPYLVWEPAQCTPDNCTGDGAWVAAGGGLAAHLGEAWQQWLPAEDGGGSCYSSEVTALAPDAHDRVWVATRGRGVLVMRDGLSVTACSRQARYERERLGAPGLRGLSAWSIGVDDQERVWIGHSDGAKSGAGVAVLDHAGTLDDWSTPWTGQTDDTWSYVDFDDVAGKTTTLVSALDVSGASPRVFAARDDITGDGLGARLYDETTGAWTPLRTADRGLPSNQIAGVAHDAPRNVTWFALAHRGVSRYDGNADLWQSWQAFANAGIVADVAARALEGDRRVRVTLASKAEYDAAFPGPARFARLGNSPTLYEVTAYGAPRGSDGPWLYVSPDVAGDVRAGAAVHRVERGPASNDARQVAVGADGDAWVGGGLTLWREGATPGTNCPTYPQCYLDGGLGHWDGRGWTVYNDANSGIPKNGAGAVQVASVLVDAAGRVWAGTGDRHAVGYGIAVFDPSTSTWTSHTYRNGLTAGDGAADLDLDASTGAVYSAHYPVTGFVTLPGGQIQRYFDGGGVARFAAGAWRSWVKPQATLRAFGDKGILESVLVDHANQLVWAGGWDGDPGTFHWLKGKDVDAVVNWCPLSDCSDGAWQAMVWPDDGTIAALAVDADGRVWAGANRAGAGVPPPVAGVKLRADGAWHAITTRNSALVDNEITALAATGERMWVGTLARGVSLYDDAPPPTPTPEPTPSATPTVTEEPTPTRTADVPPSLTPGASPTPSPSPTVVRSPTPPPCGEGGRCRIRLPACMKRA